MNTCRVLLCVSIVGLLSSCSGKTGDNSADSPVETPADKLFHEVMEGHDMGMAKVGRLRKYSQQLSHEIDSTRKSSGSQLVVASLQRVKDSLDAANAAMFEWMEGFQADTLVNDAQQRMQYLQAQKNSVLIVRDRIMNSIRLFDSIQKK